MENIFRNLFKLGLRSMVTKGSLGQRLLIVIATVFFALSALAAETPMKLRVGYAVITAGHGVSWVTKETGIFQKNGLDVELLYISTTLLSQAMLSGGVHIGAGTGIAALTSNL